MDKHVVLLGAGKSATYLIDYLKQESVLNNWQFTLADKNAELAQSKLGYVANCHAIGIDIENESDRLNLVARSDIIISLLPPYLHLLVAKDCLASGKHLLTASYLDKSIAGLADRIKEKKLLFLCEMGLDPGIDHMSALKLIDRIRNEGGTIISFTSHCGGLLAPESDNNPWHYKVSWNPRNIVMAGSAGAVFKENNAVIHKNYDQLFKEYKTIQIEGLGNLAYYPNRDSLEYMPLYALENARTFIRTTLRYPDFCKGWDIIVNAGLTENSVQVNAAGLTFKKWAEPVLPFLNKHSKAQFEFLGFFDDVVVPQTVKTSADIMQYLVEVRLVMQEKDRDMIVMLHQIEFEKEGNLRNLESLLVVKGENSVHTAMAKTVGLPLGIAAKLLLQGKISVRGLHIPVLPELYEPVLNELAQYGVRFQESEK